MPHIWGNTNTQTELNDKTFTICFPNLDQSTKGKKVNMLQVYSIIISKIIKSETTNFLGVWTKKNEYSFQNLKKKLNIQCVFFYIASNFFFSLLLLFVVNFISILIIIYYYFFSFFGIVCTKSTNTVYFSTMLEFIQCQNMHRIRIKSKATRFRQRNGLTTGLMNTIKINYL